MLRIDFVHRRITLDSMRSMRFGRAGDLVIDEENPNLHRELGEFHFSDGQWWLRNVGRSIPMRLWTSDQSSRSVVMSGSEIPITAPATTIEFEAGKSRYELTAHLESGRESRAGTVPPMDDNRTVSATDVPLTTSQRQLIVSLAEQALKNPGRAISVPPSKEAAARLGWTMTKFNSKLKNVCEKYSQIGVRGLASDDGGATMDRRLRLVEFCIFNKVVTAFDLHILDGEQNP